MIVGRGVSALLSVVAVTAAPFHAVTANGLGATATPQVAPAPTQGFTEGRTVPAITVADAPVTGGEESELASPPNPQRGPSMASTCVTFGPRWGQMGRYFSAICMSGHGYFYVVARCYDDDWRYRVTAYGQPALAPWGISEGWCPFGTHPWTRWVVIG